MFLGPELGLTGAMVSFTTYKPGAEVGFLHTHKKHEELYIVICGKGEYQVDGKTFPISEGSMIRVSPAGRRNMRNTGTTDMVVECIQYPEKSLGPDAAADGDILKEPTKW